MRPLAYVRQRARECRTMVGLATSGLFERVVRYLFDTHHIELHPANQAFLDGGRAEVSPAEGCLFYDERLDDDAAEKLLTVLHELGHVELHPRLKRCCAAPDPVYGSMYLSDGAPALTRYNRRAREEAEANAFAAEFLGASQDLLQQWQHSPTATSVSIAQELGIPVSIVQAQLAEALYWLVVGEDSRRGAPDQGALTCDPSQLEAATFTGRPALVNAGPGTGKTATLVRRIEYLLDEHGAAPEAFLILTFSNHAAEELRQRLAARFGEAIASGLEISTFHGFGVTFLHHHGQLLDIDAEATILDQASQEELVTNILGTVRCQNIVSLHNPEETVRELVRHIGYVKDRLYRPEHLVATLAAWQPSPDEQKFYEGARTFLEVYSAYEEAKAARRCVDFADLIALPIRILEANPALLERYRDKYRWVLVDEYQDVSRAVASLLRQLCGPDNPPWVVGDTRQAIYRFRGAAPKNVEQFGQDFPGAREFNLATNYRSCVEIVRVANQLATLMQTPAHEEPVDIEPWTAGTGQQALGAPAVLVARASSDLAEQEGIAAQVAAWRDLGVAASDIAVLARRNVDVRNIVLALGQHGIQATTAGLVTPEGAAGDLAVVATLPDQPHAALPRLAFALGGGRYNVRVINAVISRMLDTLADDGTFATQEYGAGNALAAALRCASDRLYEKQFSGDALAMMCTFLFDGSDYLRRLLEQPIGAERSLALCEVVTSLTRAAGYRFTHPEAEPRLSRLGFGQYFRASLSASSPGLVPPQPTADSVRVMTCHAAKGLEFPCVIVAGQTLAQAPRVYKWLPPCLQPPAQDDARQSDALFFVGATRAQRALVVTYATSAGGTVRSRGRNVTPLLDWWHTRHAVPTRALPSRSTVRERVPMGAIWGGSPGGVLTARALDKDACAIRTYLEHYLQVRFPTSVPALYPIFFDAVRRVMGRIVRRAHEIGTRISLDEAEDILWRGWPTQEVAEHPHLGLYFDLARTFVARFAHAYTPQANALRHLDLIMDDAEVGLALRLDLLAHYLVDNGTAVAIALRPESLAEKHRRHGLLWSALRTAHRVSFVVLKQRHPNLRPYVFSAADGVLYPYMWASSAQDIEKETERLAERGKALAQQRFETTVQEWTCDRCPVRLSCPHWLGALG
jgi:DNA helicase-2/ATP-dependent DNA helicase PcrA